MSLKLSAGGDTQGSAGSAASLSALQCWLRKQGLGLLLQPPTASATWRRSTSAGYF